MARRAALSRRQRARLARQRQRQQARLARIQARRAPRLARIQAKQQAGFWSPEAVAERQQSLREGIGAGAALAETAGELGLAYATGGASAALGALGGDDEYEGGGGGGGGAGLPSWALPAGLAGAALLVVLLVVAMMSGTGKSGRKAA